MAVATSTNNGRKKSDKINVYYFLSFLHAAFYSLSKMQLSKNIYFIEGGSYKRDTNIEAQKKSETRTSS